ncbi:MAG: SGNH/GDSL hydrolase family protein [Hyphomicrobiales bacterium]|nr:SGNH/GDSL hydrolase family protein [Hyphomicrobiales bacterium]
MAAKISLAQIVQKIQTGALTDQDKRQYFVVEPDPARPMNFRIFVNAENVDIAGLERLAQNADPLFASITRHGRGKHKGKATKGGASARYIVAKGDSWFRLPHFPGIPGTMIDVLQEQDTTDTIVNLAHWGDTLADMLQSGDFWQYVDADYDLLLFSAGGNDILGGGNLASMLNLFDPGHTKASDALYYIKPAFYTQLAAVVANLESGLIAPLKNRRKKTQIVMHGYDYVAPFPNGPWIGGPMAQNGLNVQDYQPLCLAIVRCMIDAYNASLAGLAAKYPTLFHYLDLRGTVAANGWWIEMHAKEAGAQSYETKLKALIDKVDASPHLQARRRLYAPVAAPVRAA